MNFKRELTTRNGVCFTAYTIYVTLISPFVTLHGKNIKIKERRPEGRHNRLGRQFPNTNIDPSMNKNSANFQQIKPTIFAES